MKYRFLLILSGVLISLLSFGDSMLHRDINLGMAHTNCAITGILSHDNVTCYGGSDGVLRIRSVLAGGDVEYSIDNGNTWQEDSTFYGLSANNYAIVVRQQLDHSCLVVLDPAYLISEPSQLSAIIIKENISCFTANDGKIALLNPTGGSGTYEYSINGVTWQDSPLFENLSSASYTIRIRDKATPGCVRILPGSYFVSKPAQLSSIVSTDEITCNGAANGAIYFKSNLGGSGSFIFSIDNGANWQASGDFTNLSGGIYPILIGDANNVGCTRAIGSVNLNEPAPMVANFTKTDANCYGASNGSIEVEVTGNYSNYLFSKDGGASFEGSGASTHTFFNLSKGSYPLVVKVGNISPACLYTLPTPVDVDEPDQLSADIVKTNLTCYGVNTGSIEFANITGGSGAYEYRIKNTLGWSVSPLFSNQAAGNYNVRIRDANATGCEVILNSSLQITQPAILSGQIASIPNTCFQTNDGLIVINNSSGGSLGNFQYSINGGSSWSNSSIFPNLPADSYNVRIRDKDLPSCVRVLSSNYKILEPADLNATLEYVNPNCFGESNGSIIFKNQTGRPISSLSYSIDGGNNWNVEDTVLNLPAGNYDVRIKDQFSVCYKVINPSLNLIQPGQLGATFTKTDLTCYGDSSGQIAFTNLVGGTGLYNFSTDGGSTWGKNAIVNNLQAGSYNLVIRDSLAKKCTTNVQNNVVLSQPTELKSSISNNLIECYGDATGEITFSGFSGGNPPYLFSIDGGVNYQASPYFYNLTAGVYPALIKDPICENAINSALVINQNPQLGVDISQEDITCFGNATGKIILSNPRGGNGTSYQYSKDDGFSWNTYSGTGDFEYTGLVAGNYNLKMKDAACIVPLSTPLTINQVAALAAGFDKEDVSCFGANNGRITFKNMTGGSGIYEFRIKSTDPWSTNPNFSNLAPGNYTLLVRDQADFGCILSLGIVTITQPAILSAVVNKSNTNCQGVNNGQISFANPTGGHGNYEYSIDGGNTWNNVGYSNLPVGNYSVFIRDADTTSCRINLGDYSISEPAELQGDVEVDSVTCFGGSNGILSILNVTGGSGSYEYSFDNQITWGVQASKTGLSAGTYQVHIRDLSANTCVKYLGAFTITQPNIIAVSTNQKNQVCFGGNVGEIQFQATGGSGQYNYSINNGTTWSSSNVFNNLSAGVYQVRVNDNLDNACQIAAGTVTITEPAKLQILATATDVHCFGASTGAISVNVTGGVGPFEYSIDNGTTYTSLSSFSGLIKGAYVVTVREKNTPSCLGNSSSILIKEPQQLNASFTKVDVTCFGGNNGSITLVKGTSETRNLEYSINNGSTWFAFNQFTGLAKGTYSVGVRNADTTSCFRSIGLAVLNQPDELAAVVNTDSVTCFGGSNGQINVENVTGGSGLYEYSFDNGLSWSSSNKKPNLTAGNYAVSLRDANDISCVKNLGLVSINEPTVIVSTATAINANCFGTANGSISLQSTGGSGQFEYKISTGTIWQSSKMFTNLPAGNYSIEVRDVLDNTCLSIVPSVLISEPAQIQVNTTSNPVDCFGSSTGSIDVNTAGGVGPFEYSIDNGASWTAFTPFLGLKKGTYDIIARETNTTSCVSAPVSVTVIEPKQLDASANTLAVTCHGGNDGSISITKGVSESRNLEYSIDNGSTWSAQNLYSNLTEGTYSVIVRNADTTSCFRSIGIVIIGQPDELAAIVNSDSVSCFGGSNGQILVENASGGSGLYEYSFDNGVNWSTSNSMPNLLSGSYVVSIRDANNTSCSKTLGIAVINEPTQIISTSTVSDVNCSGSSSGSISIQSKGGSGQFEYSIDMGAQWQTLNTYTNLPAGNYSIEVRDLLDNACQSNIAPIIIAEPTAIQVNATANPVDCFGKSTGSIEVATIGGTGSFEYSIDNGTSWTAFTPFLGLKKGTYDIIARETNTTTCVTAPVSIAVIEPEQLNASASSADVTCYSGNNGEIVFTKDLSENRNLEYSIDNGVTWLNNPVFGGLAQGNYPLSIRNADTTSCFRSIGNAVINQASALSANVESDSATCFGGSNGNISITNVTGGSGNYEYSFDNGFSWTGVDNQGGMAAGNYMVSLRDANDVSCILNLGAIAVTEPAEIIVNQTTSNTSCFGADNGSINIVATGGSGQFEYSLETPTQWSALSQINLLPAGSYKYLVRDVLDNSCIATSGNIVISEPAELSAIVSKNDIGCSGTPKGSIQLSSVSGGSGSYEYSYDNKMTWVSTTQLLDLSAGIVPISIRDQLVPVCVIDLPAVEIESFEILTDAPLVTDASCSDKSDGSIILNNVSGGVSNVYEYSINGGLSWQISNSFAGLNKGNYDIIVRNPADISCARNISNVSINSPDELNVQGMVQDISCVENGAIYLEIPIGGLSGTYEFSLDGTTWTDQLEFTNLNAGVYSLIMRDAADISCFRTIASNLDFQDVKRISGYVNIDDVIDVTGCVGNTNGGFKVYGDEGIDKFQFSIYDGNSWSDFTSTVYNAFEPCIYNNLASGTYQVRIQDPDNAACPYTIPEPIVIGHDNVLYPATVALTNEIHICDTESTLNISAQTSNVTSYQWSLDGVDLSDGNLYSGTQTSQLNILSVTSDLNDKTFVLKVDGNCQPASSSASVNVKIDEQIMSTIVGDLTMCLGQTGNFIDLVGIDTTNVETWMVYDNDLKSWSAIQNSNRKLSIPVFSDPDKVYYKALLRNGICPSVYTDSVEMIFNPLPDVDAGIDTIILEGASVQLNGSGGTNFYWTPGATLSDSTSAIPLATPDQTSVYYYHAENEYGCMAFDSVIVTLLIEAQLFIPNTFTPNGDGINDLWVIRAISKYPSSSVEIFNRWGMQLYQKDNGIIPWDGVSDGKVLPTGTYFYVIKLSPDSNPIAGSISIVR